MSRGHRPPLPSKVAAAALVIAGAAMAANVRDSRPLLWIVAAGFLLYFVRGPIDAPPGVCAFPSAEIQPIPADYGGNFSPTVVAVGRNVKS